MIPVIIGFDVKEAAAYDNKCMAVINPSAQHVILGVKHHLWSPYSVLLNTSNVRLEMFQVVNEYIIERVQVLISNVYCHFISYSKFVPFA